MKTPAFKNTALWLLTAMLVCGAAHAATPAPGTTVNMPTPGGIALGGGIQMDTVCPAPYHKDTSGWDVKKGESECIKTAATCPDAYDSHRNDQTGQLTCTLKQIPGAPQGWAPGTGGGTLVFESLPQPMVFCPKSTPDWKWGTVYWKDSWNRMGCRANLKPAS